MRPLADRMRPASLVEVVGQERWLSEKGALRKAMDDGALRSMVLWGPPGCGKTTIARILAQTTGVRFVQLSAVLDGVKRLREVLEEAKLHSKMGSAQTLLFVDEIHRWNKAQQDALLPHVEQGAVVLVGATTENPSFELNAALRSRLQIVRLEPLSAPDVEIILRRATSQDETLSGLGVSIEEEVYGRLAVAAAGDARRALDDLERCIAALEPEQSLTADGLEDLLQRADLRHDRSGEDHYNVVSALIKSMRGSDPDAAVYWLARMLVAGEDPNFVARRLVIFAAEDVGNADPRALTVAVDAAQAVRLIGMPEARIPLAQAVTWLACCPKSNAAYKAINQAMADVRATGALSVPMHLRNAVTADMSSEGYGKGYRYPHDFPGHVVKQSYLPEDMAGRQYYLPAPHGVEKVIAERLAWWQQKIGNSTGEREG